MEALGARAVEGWRVREVHFRPDIYCYYPTKTRSVSVTGSRCELNCAHCGGHYLKRMLSLDDIGGGEAPPARSLLVSGGCTDDGRVPIREHATELRRLKPGLRFNLHVGLVQEDDIEAIAPIADKVSFDFVGDDETIREVLGIPRTVENYTACYKKLRERCSVIPHICIGLHGGEIRGELRAIELLRELGAEGLTFIVFTPTRGSRFADRLPPGIDSVLEVLVEARKAFPSVPINLGCMRPGGSYRSELDQWAVRAGINGIVNPVPAAVRQAESLGLTVIRREECCVL